MAIPEEFKGKYFYHFTHIDNLKSILENGFLCTNEKDRLGISHQDVANGNIQGRRHNMNIPIQPGGTVHDYVPFYFCSRNPMLLGVTNSKNIDQPFLIFLAIPIDRILEDDVLFTDASANTLIPPNFYSEPKMLLELDWTEIDSPKWGTNKMHERMAEALIYKQVPLDWITNIIVWNQHFHTEVTRLLEEYNVKGIRVQYEPLNKKYFYYTKFGIAGRDTETLVTGPYYLKGIFNDVVSDVIKSKEKKENKCNFKNIDELITAIDIDFNVINELDGIFELETLNEIHDENVSDHVLNVVKHLTESVCFKAFDKNDQNILKLSAYFHDIGKGPHNKWKDKKQPVYPDHPVDSLLMMKRILIEEIEILSEYEIRMICLLVGYHDLIGEIFGKGRDKKQLFDLLKNEKEFDMLNCLSHADVKSFNNDWDLTYKMRVVPLKKEFLEHLEE